MWHECTCVADCPAARISDVDVAPPNELRLYGGSKVKFFCCPKAATRKHPLLVDGGFNDLEINATLLTVGLLGECRVWIKHFEQIYVRNRCTGEIDSTLKLLLILLVKTVVEVR